MWVVDQPIFGHFRVDSTNLGLSIGSIRGQKCRDLGDAGG